ncbi:MAG: hypothetical protein VCA36_11050 [Opitutales bacterium]
MKSPPLGLPLIAVTVGVVGIVAFSILRPVTKPYALEDFPEPKVDLIDLTRNAIQADQAKLEDSAPLFLPTPFNASIPPTIAEVGDIINIPVFDPELFGNDSSFLVGGPGLPFSAPVSKDISKWLKKPFSTFGLGRKQVMDVNGTTSQGELVISLVGKINESKSIPLELPPTYDNYRTVLWSPAEFFCSVEKQTAMGWPLQTKSSGIRELDEVLTSFVRKMISEEGLDTGYYRITAYP